MMPAKILYVHQDGAVTGSAISLRNLISGLDRERFTPYVLLAKEGPARDLYEALGVQVDVVKIHAFWTFPGPTYFERGFIQNFRTFLPNHALTTYFSALAPDIVHVNDKAMLSAGLTAKKCGLPVIWHLRSTYVVTNAQVNAWISKQVIRHCADRLVAISEDEMDGFEDSTHLQVVFNSVDLNASQHAISHRDNTRLELGFRDHELVVGLVGALDERKGAWDFIKAAGIVRKAVPQINFRFAIMANIPDRTAKSQGLLGKLKCIDTTHPEDKSWKLADDAGIRDILTLTGFRHDPLNVMAAFDIVVVANRLGVLGRPPFEAMSVGRPLIATSGHTGNSNVVKPGVTARVVPPKDIEALAEAITQLSLSSELRHYLSANGVHYARENFDSKKNALRVQAIYEELLKSRNMVH